ncbi:hypothetical protein [Alteromonas halophila]|uniref:hypothetical protein n=1 Tax=Alteromonas halophila TaxID=516698 RepID=UPI00167BA34C|nr:hypothetical protein [Alteromonas halophila]
MKTVKILVATLIFISVNANAGLIQWDVTGDPSTNGWTMTGWVQIDSSNLQSNTDIGANIVNWMFNWTDGNLVLSNSSGAGDSFNPAYSSFIVDSSFEVSSASLCAKDCNGVSDWPAIFVSQNTWNASFANNGCCISITPASWVRASNVSVNAPSTFAILSLGIVALASRRFRKE